jgi:hypothetical protein
LKSSGHQIPATGRTTTTDGKRARLPGVGSAYLAIIKI